MLQHLITLLFYRRTTVILSLFLLLLGSISLNAQTNKVSITLNDARIITVLDQIRSQTDIHFVYNHEELEKCPNVSISVIAESVEDVLTYCLEGSNLSFEKLKNTYIITPRGEQTETQKGGQLKGSLKGKVIDSDSKVPLPYSTVIVLSTDPRVGATTDEDGYFRFGALPVGRHKIMVSYVGYADLIMSEIFVGSSKEIEIIAEITEKVESIDEVSVGIDKGLPINQMATVSATSFRIEETKRYAASISDPARMVLVFAGVAGNDDATNEIVIRGNSPNWLLWRLEGVEIPSPNHLSEEGFTSGSVSILSSDMLGTSDFYMGAFPAEFGSALSGVFDLKMRKGNNEKHEFSAQAGVLGLDFSAEGPLSKGYKGSYLINYRYSTLSLLDKINIQVSENALPGYKDLSFKFNFPTKRAGTFSLWAIGGRSESIEEYFPDDSTNTKLQGYRDNTRAGMYATGITHTYYPDDKSYFRSVISHSRNTSSEIYETMDSLGLLNLLLEDELQNNAIRISTLYNRKLSSKFTIRTGATLNMMSFDFYSKIADNAGSHKTFLNGDGRTSLFQGYVQSKYRISDRLISTVGLHYAYFALSDDHSLEPRLGLMYDLPGRQRISFGYGRHSKNENLPLYFVEVENADGSHSYPNSELKMTRSDHYIASYEKMIGNDIQLKTEIYLQLINNLPVPTNPDKYWTSTFSVTPDDTLANIGVARNFGIEFTFRKFFTDGYYLMLTNSLFDARYKPANGEWFNSKYNLKHVSNFVGGKEFRWSDKMLGINSKIMWSGGKRIWPLDLASSIQAGYAVYDNSKLFERQGPNYFRIDFGINLHLFKQRVEHIFSLDIQNLTNRRNIWSEEYDPVLEELTYYYLTGFIPILNYRVEF